MPKVSVIIPVYNAAAYIEECVASVLGQSLDDLVRETSAVVEQGFTALKLKVAASIVAISSIHLLQIFMNAQQTPNDKILWYVILHLTFVISSVLMAVMDRIGHRSH